MRARHPDDSLPQTTANRGGTALRTGYCTNVEHNYCTGGKFRAKAQYILYKQCHGSRTSLLREAYVTCARLLFQAASTVVICTNVAREVLS